MRRAIACALALSLSLLVARHAAALRTAIARDTRDLSVRSPAPRPTLRPYVPRKEPPGEERLFRYVRLRRFCWQPMPGYEDRFPFELRCAVNLAALRAMPPASAAAPR